MNKIAFCGIFFALSLAATACTFSGAAVQTSNGADNTDSNAGSQTAPEANTQTAPDAVVADLYKRHDARKSPFFQDKNRALVDKFFTKKTADMIWKDAIDSKGEVGALGADPLYDAQNVEIKNFKVGKADIKGDQAEVPVTFRNFGEKQTITFLLRQEKGVWKIEDIRYADGRTLTEMFEDIDSTSDGDKQGKGDKNAVSNSAGEFEGKYQVGNTTATVKPVKMAFEVKWEKGTGTEIFFFEDRANDKYIFASNPDKGKANVFAFDDENYNTGTFYRGDGKEFAVSRIK